MARGIDFNDYGYGEKETKNKLIDLGRKADKVILSLDKIILDLKEVFCKEGSSYKLPKYTPPEPPPRNESTVKKYRVMFDDGREIVINEDAFNDLSFSLKINPHSDHIILNGGVYIKSLDSIKSISPIESRYGI